MQPAFHLIWPLVITLCLTPRRLPVPVLRHGFNHVSHYYDGQHIAGVQ